MGYNYVTSAALDVGLALMAIFIFFFVQLPGATMPDWWGTTVLNTADQNQEAIKLTVADGEIFGPPRGSWKW